MGGFSLPSTVFLRLDGGYSEWSGFTECSRTCGGGIRLRRRVCSNPYPRLGGRNCSSLGKPVQVFRCNRNPCPVNGGYGNWLPFGACSLTCGEGTKQRRRNCDNPLPQYGGKNCREIELGEDTETVKCNERKCPVHGGYSEWSKYSDCSVTCGSGVKKRNRKCTNPVPDPDGKDCTVLGPSEESLPCNTEACPTPLPPTTTIKTTSNKPLIKTDKPITKPLKPTAKQQNPSTVMTNEPTKLKSGSAEDQAKASGEKQPNVTKIPTTGSKERQEKKTEEKPKATEELVLKSTEMPPRSTDTKPKTK